MRRTFATMIVAVLIVLNSHTDARAQEGSDAPDIAPLVECAEQKELVLPTEKCMLEEAFWSAQWAMQSSAAQALDAVNARFAQGTGELAALARNLEEDTNKLAEVESGYFVALGLSDGLVREARLAELNPQLEQIKQRLQSVEIGLQDRFPEYSQLVAPQPLTVAETQAMLGPEDALFMALPGETGTFVFLLTHETADWHRSSLTRSDLTIIVDELRLSMGVNGVLTGVRSFQEDGPIFDRSLAFELYTNLFGPLASKIGSADHLYATVSGPLTAFPMGAMVTQAPEGNDSNPDAMRGTSWLQRDVAITVLPAPTSLRALAERKKTNADRAFLGIGNACTGWGVVGAPEPPVELCGRIEGEEQVAAKDRVAASNSRSGLRFSKAARAGKVPVLSADELRFSMSYLPGTRTELLAIASLLSADPEYDLIMARDASEALLRSSNSQLSESRVIVFATHGLVATDGIENLDEPGLVLTPPSVASALDDGFLSASEIAADLTLDADFVVLSACNTASPAKSGADSLSGLARAFFYAGARSLLVSHWPVEDDIAPQITTATIENFDRTPANGRSRALKAALLPLMDDPETADPYYWAPFVLVGQN